MLKWLLLGPTARATLMWFDHLTSYFGHCYVYQEGVKFSSGGERGEDIIQSPTHFTISNSKIIREKELLMRSLSTNQRYGNCRKSVNVFESCIDGNHGIFHHFTFPDLNLNGKGVKELRNQGEGVSPTNTSMKPLHLHSSLSLYDTL